jgi:hypothetical protein
LDDAVTDIPCFCFGPALLSGGVCVVGVLDVRPNVSCLFLLLQRVQAALPSPPPQHLVATEQTVLTVTMTPPRVVTNVPVRDKTPNNWQQGHTNHHSTTQLANHHNTSQQLTNHHSTGQAPKRTHRDYIFGKVIGEGSFSTVYLAKDIHNGKECAGKSATLSFSLLSSHIYATRILHA